MSTTKKINARIKLKGETSENWRQSNLVPIKNEMLLVHDKGNAIVMTEENNEKPILELIKNPPYFFPILRGVGANSVIEGKDTAWDYKETKLQQVQGTAKVDDRDFYGETKIFTITITNPISEESLEKITHIRYQTWYEYWPTNEDYSIQDTIATVQGLVLSKQTNDDGITNLLCEVTYPILQIDSYMYPINTWQRQVTNIDLYTIVIQALDSRGNAADSAAAHSEGLNNIIGYGSQSAHAEGKKNIIENAEAAHIEGYNNTLTGSSSTTGGNAAHIEGQHNRLQGDKSHGAHIEGGSNYGNGQYVHVEGAGNHATKDRAHAEGYQTRAEGDQSHTEGLRTNTKNSAAHAEGVDTIAWGRGSHVEGNTTVALTAHSHAEGEHTLAGAKGYYWEAIEFTKDAEDVITGGTIYLCAEQLPKGEFPIIGTGKRYDNLVPGYAIGDTIAIINQEHFYTNAKITTIDHNIITYEGDIGFTEIKTLDEEDDIRDLDEYSMWVVTTPDPLKTEGTVYASALNTNAHAEGLATQALGEGAHSEGGACIAYGDFAHAEGKYTKASYSAHAEGDSTNAIGQRSHAEGTRTTALGNSSHVEGTNTKANDYNAHAEGKDSTASGVESHAEGNNTQAIGEASHAEGFKTQAIGKGAHAEGVEASIKYTQEDEQYIKTQSPLAQGIGAHAEGYGTQTNGTGAHAEGQGISFLAYNQTFYVGKAEGTAAHVEGMATIAKGEGAHAEGRYTYAEGYSVHAEGYLTKATANHAHVEGRETEASGAAAHAGGRGTKATAEAQTAIGKYNRVNNDALFIVGKGTGSADNQRSNAFEVLKDGNANIAGTLNVTALTIGGVNILPIAEVEFPGGDA